MSVPIRSSAIQLPAFAVLVLFASAAAAQEMRPGDCATLEDLKIEDTNLLSSAVVPAKDGLPEYCRVLGYVRPAINFEIRLPTKDWNSKFYMAGCGSRCGKVEADRPGFTNAPNHGLRRNYAVSTMDGGHWGATRSDITWLQSRDPIARFDYDQRAVTATAKVTKEVIKAFYGTDPRKSYFAGCSTGGRQANMEAWKYAADFDGIISGCPTLDASGNEVYWAWILRANTGPGGEPILAFSKVPMIAQAVQAACSGEDGLVDDPNTCGFRPESLLCRGGDGPDCLTADEVGVLRKWYDGPRNSRGERIQPGVPLGSEPYWANQLGLDSEQTWRKDKARAEAVMRYDLLPADPGPGYDIAAFDFDRDPERVRQALANRDADGTDLSKFKARGGKLLIYQGLGDASLPPEATRLWYEDLTKAMGGAAATRDFARLFLISGMDHCGTQSGPGVHHSGFDPLPALERWVEEGMAPESIVMTKTDKDGRTEWTRPVCVYPQVARHQGSGDMKDAASWSCGTP
jgi:feruloyl esterase